MKDLEELLREDARERLPDAGFTQRVMGALPAPVPRTRPWLTPMLVLGSTALGSVLAMAFAPQGLSIAQGFVDVVQMRGFTPAAVMALALGAALTSAAILLAADAD
jgi:hypothetical protein